MGDSGYTLGFVIEGADDGVFSGVLGVSGDALALVPGALFCFAGSVVGGGVSVSAFGGEPCPKLFPESALEGDDFVFVEPADEEKDDSGEFEDGFQSEHVIYLQ